MSRFPIRESLEIYSDRELMTIVQRQAANEGLQLPEESLQLIARSARGTPRAALSLLRRVRDEVLAADLESVDHDFVHRALAELGIDARGLGPVDRGTNP